MIDHVKTKGFKGQDINEDIHPKTLFCGPNTSGKSTRAAAIALTLMGYVPFAAKPSKQPAAILDDYGNGAKDITNTLTVAVACNGVEFERHYYRTEKGGVSQRLRVDKKKHSAADFAVALAKAGSPRVIDVGDFIGLSDQKKMDMVFEIFPPKSNLNDLDNRIEKAKKAVTELQGKDRSATSVIQRLTKSKGEIEMPAGTLAEIQAEIEKLTDQVNDAREQLKQAEISDAEEKAKDKAAAEASVNQGPARHESPPSNHVEKQEIQPIKREPGNQRILDFVQGKPAPSDEKYPHFMKVYDEDNDPAVSIQKIIDTLNDSGCGICAAAIVAKQELKKFTKGVAA